MPPRRCFAGKAGGLGGRRYRRLAAPGSGSLRPGTDDELHGRQGGCPPTVNASNPAPMAASLSPVGIIRNRRARSSARRKMPGYPRRTSTLTSVAPYGDGIAAGTAQAPVGSFITFRLMPTGIRVLGQGSEQTADESTPRFPTRRLFLRSCRQQ